ncbi:MAG: hypothetical protein JWL95_272, partial [Gemmatimonadetes bacterium]|nr:hypothetical protein [Gemmatimonadota bacterium]
MPSSRRHLLALGLFALASLTPSARAQAPSDPDGGFVVIVNLANPIIALPRLDASRLFLRKRNRWPSGQYAEPMDQVESSPVRRRFSKAIHR